MRRPRSVGPDGYVVLQKHWKPTRHDRRKMTPEAWGVFCHLKGMPPGWEARVDNLCQEFRSGRDKMARILNELVEFRFLIREFYGDAEHPNLRRSRLVLNHEWLTADRSPGDAGALEVPTDAQFVPEPGFQGPEDPDPQNPDPQDQEPGNPAQVNKEGVSTEVVSIEGASKEPPPPPSPPRPTRAPTVRLAPPPPTEPTDETPDPDTDLAVAAFVAGLPRPRGLRLAYRDAEAFAGHVRRFVLAGADMAALRRELLRELDGATHHERVWLARLRDGIIRPEDVMPVAPKPPTARSSTRSDRSHDPAAPAEPVDLEGLGASLGKVRPDLRKRLVVKSRDIAAAAGLQPAASPI